MQAHLQSFMLSKKLPIVDGGPRALGDPRHRGRLSQVALALAQTHNPIGQDAATLTAHGQDGDLDGLSVGHD